MTETDPARDSRYHRQSARRVAHPAIWTAPFAGSLLLRQIAKPRDCCASGHIERTLVISSGRLISKQLKPMRKSCGHDSQTLFRLAAPRHKWKHCAKERFDRLDTRRRWRRWICATLAQLI